MGELASLLADLVERHWEILNLSFVVVGLIIYVVASHSLHQRRHPSAAIAWVLGLVLFPYHSLRLYLAFGSRKVVASRFVQSARRVNIPAPVTHATAARSQQLGVAMGLPDPVAYEGLCIHDDGSKSLVALRRVIDRASHTLEISTFIFGRDVLGDEIAEKLKQRARAGVRFDC